MGANNWFPRFWGTMDALRRREGFYFWSIFAQVRLPWTDFVRPDSNFNICSWNFHDENVTKILEGNGNGREMIKIVMHDVDYSPELPSLDIIDKYFDGDWRRGKEIHRVTITNRLYQISPGETKAWFSNDDKQHRCCRQIFDIAHRCQKVSPKS